MTPPRCIRPKKSPPGHHDHNRRVRHPGTALQTQVAQLQHDLTKRMRRFGRQCRGMGKVFVTLVRQTETHLLELGQPVLTLAKTAQACLHGTPQLAETSGCVWTPSSPPRSRPTTDRTPIATADAE